MSKLPDVRGRITYISSHAKQENLYAVYETADRHYWTELAKCNQQEFEKSGTEGKCNNSYIACKEQVTKWEKTYGDDNQKRNKESVLERLRNPPKKTADYQQQGTLKGKDRGAR